RDRRLKRLDRGGRRLVQQVGEQGRAGLDLLEVVEVGGGQLSAAHLLRGQRCRRQRRRLPREAGQRDRAQPGRVVGGRQQRRGLGGRRVPARRRRDHQRPGQVGRLA